VTSSSRLSSATKKRKPSRNSAWLFYTQKHRGDCRGALHNYYNDNRKSKFLNFDGKSLICIQFSPGKTVDFCFNECASQKASLLFGGADLQIGNKRAGLSPALLHNYYNDNRKSKFTNFDGKSLICIQFSPRKTVDFCFNECASQKACLLFWGCRSADRQQKSRLVACSFAQLL